ncbi:hypothetical protein M1843_03970 [Isoptericola sp. 4D.3]|uniref:Uncharacterized protein n=1 Tax=Isoptericola peretonis TaxID=2918523 RepID=A0ABT0J096_9MICO|nr:hypothetical protein [Isoptericola sp. 4D.3]
MTETGPGPRLLRARVLLALLVVLLTGLFAYLFAYVWTDELVDGSPYAIADPAGTGVEGALAGLLPMVLGLALCALMLWGTGVAWWWPALLVVAGGGVGAVLGVSTRFSEGMPALAAAALATAALAGAIGLVANCRTLLRRVDAQTSRP